MRRILIDELAFIPPANRVEASPPVERARVEAVVDLDAVLAEARAEERVIAAEAAALAREQADLARERAVAEAREAWAASEGAVLAAALSDGLARMERALGDAVARVLLPYVDGLQHERLLAAFVEALRAAVEDPARPPLTIRGRPDLLDALRRAYPDIDTVASLRSADGANLVLDADPLQLASRFGDWARLLTRATEAGEP
ncbi:hypothetical protein [Chthonobacter rhizosphaerae]|uniref:hypothetical protein n=1 Tax=Chthonobacter rhizosphaerae TaxID=2735553 RepID=UPI0015EF9DA9|nr:hypothetical protein [Chthonobacter rhizosphaerae]